MPRMAVKMAAAVTGPFLRLLPHAPEWMALLHVIAVDRLYRQKQT